MPAFADTLDTAVRQAVAQELIGTAQPVVGLLDLNAVEERIAALTGAFAPAGQVLHTVACKAVTLVPVLRFLAERGLGCEVASPGEYAMAQAAGFPAERIVLDSPAKTEGELRRALGDGASLNIDSYQEMERVDALLGELAGASAESAAGPASVIGVRVNPVVGAGSIGQMSTATTTTKFGVPLVDAADQDRLIAAIRARPHITQLHVHTGSQGIPLELAAAGIRRVVELADAINDAAGQQQIARIDMGGGLSVNFLSNDITPTFEDYADVLKREVPELLDGRYGLVTEFGRALLAKAGTIATRIEYTKTVGSRRFAIGHAGAQTATRTAFVPEHWPLRISARAADGAPSPAPSAIQDLAGPCCFTGDMIGRDYDVPEFQPGDIALIHDVGAYYFSTPFAYNALPRIPVYAYRAAEARVEFALVRRQQTVEELLAEAGEDVVL
ncbi:diaminopimelate decarboxylase [Brevibacterium sp. 5221]|uniref:Diaminopimelate decarboxylase n=1 Tax=Brevibacterium rongguiense TaxID=2695267 RepID=A0A6N9H6Y6_9MICO|nr:diaminopimelate decarboxylase [Brevibacterium rongguiense]MYM19828.1 diaminopimelate decarboxylase [Brevibacterium rongguiense]